MSLLQYTEEDKQEIWKNYGKDAKIVEEDIKSIQTWMEKQPHLPEITDAKVIERFLMLNKFSVERAKEKLEMYYTIRSLIPEFYDKNSNDPEIKKVMDIIYYLPLPKLTKDLHRVTVIKPTGVNSDDLDAVVYLAHSLNITEVRLREDYCLSEIHIYDLGGVKVSHLLKFTPAIAKKGALVIEKVFSSRAQGIHIVNAPSFINPFLTTLKSLLTPKLSERIFIHYDVEGLHDLISKSVLPKDYGGEERSLAELNEQWKNKLVEYDDLFQKLCEIRVNEDLRPIKVNSEMLGIEGNFRKLDFD